MSAQPYSRADRKRIGVACLPRAAYGRPIVRWERDGITLIPGPGRKPICVFDLGKPEQIVGLIDLTPPPRPS